MRMSSGHRYSIECENSQRQIQHAVLQLSTVSDPYKLQLLLEAIANTRYHIRYE